MVKDLKAKAVRCLHLYTFWCTYTFTLAHLKLSMDLLIYRVNKTYKGDLNEPPNYKAALSNPEFDKWLEAMNTKMQSMKTNQVWILVDLPRNGQTVGSKWLFKKKTDMDGKKFRMENSKKGYTPMIEKPDYSKPQGAKTPSEVQRIYRIPYALAIGSIMMRKSAKQSTTAMYSIEAEYIVTAKASIKAVWMRKFIDRLGGFMTSNKRPMKMLCDNEAAIAIVDDPKILKGAIHFQRKYHYIREVI
nr:hypothetical protein [Tanacetum cinerariifolium]